MTQRVHKNHLQNGTARQIHKLKWHKNKKDNDFSPENDKTHKMKERAVDKYKVQIANTEIFKKFES